jgi:hypothetical protein
MHKIAPTSKPNEPLFLESSQGDLFLGFHSDECYSPKPPKLEARNLNEVQFKVKCNFAVLLGTVCCFMINNGLVVQSQAILALTYDHVRLLHLSSFGHTTRN